MTEKYRINILRCGLGKNALHIPALIMAVLEDPDRLPFFGSGNVVVSTDRLLPPVIFDSLWSINKLQRPIPKKLIIPRSYGVGLF